jgi:hypothetical protein
LVTSQNSAAETARCMGLHRAAAHLEAAELNDIAKSIPYQSESAASALRL